MAKNKRITISDIAAHLGIHKSTVSRALNYPDRISEELSQKVKKAVKELNYIPNQAARNILLTHTNTLALLIPSIVNTVFNDVVTGVKSVTDKAGYSLMIGNSTYSELGEEKVVESYIQQAVDGFILTSTRHTKRTISMLRSAGIPVAEIMDMSENPFDINYGVDQEAAAADATNYLISKGYKKIAFCSLVLDWRAVSRKKGWKKALDDAGLDSSMSISSREMASYQTGANLLIDVLQTWQDVDALFFVSDELAAGAVMECHRRDIKLRKDLAICGFNDLAIAASIYPSLTTVATPRSEMGEKAASSIIDLIDGKPVADPIQKLSYSIKARETT